MDVIELVQKQNPDFGREALLETFVNAHFNELTGELLGEEYEFHRVLNLLGRKDLNLGDIPNRIGNISFNEKKSIHLRFQELKRSVPKPKRPREVAGPHGPYMRNLSQTELMVLQAFNSSGNTVTNPAVATTLVQAYLEKWFPAVTLPMDAKDILMQCMNQGDMQAAYLLGFKRNPSEKKDSENLYFIESEEERRSYLAAAKAHGNPGAIEWLMDEQMREEMYESVREDQDTSYLDWIDSDIKQAIKFGPSSTGLKLFHWGVKLAEANNNYFLYINNDTEIFDLNIYKSRHKLALDWIFEAAIINAEARYYIATSKNYFPFYEIRSPLIPRRLDEVIGLSNLTDAEIKWKLIRSAAFPENGIDPYYPAFIDIAEQALIRMAKPPSGDDNSVVILDEVRRYLVECIDLIANPDCKQALRIATLWESVDIKGHIEKAIHYYSVAAKDSSFGAFKCAIFSLRALKPGDDISLIRRNFELALNAPLRHGERLDEKARDYSEIALKIGWVVDSEPASWEEASMLLMRQIDGVGYVPQMQNTWILPSDVDLLLQHSTSYERYKHWISEWRSVLEKMLLRRESTASEESVQATLDRKLKGIYLLYGTSKPSSILKLLSAWANDSEYVHSESALKGIDRTSIIYEYLVSQVLLREKDGQGIALGGFKKVLAMMESTQEIPGGLGVSFVAKSLKWLQKKSFDGLNNAQPNCRRVSIGSEMNGQASDFGSQLLNVITQNLENGAIPGKSVATEVIYKDRYINTPFKVAVLAKAIEAIVDHLKKLSRWGNSDVKIYVGGLAKCENDGTLNQSISFRDSKERNIVLQKILFRSGIEVSIPKTKAPHGRDLIVRFADSSELRVGIDKGMSYWTAVNGGNCSINDYNPNSDIDEKVKFLVGNVVSIGQTEDECPVYVEWHEGNSFGSENTR